VNHLLSAKWRWNWFPAKFKKY